jgi:CheY-like chemotaxis protein
MNAILGFSRLLEHAENDRERAEYVKILNDNGIMLMQLMDDIIDISKMDAGQYEISLSEFRIEPLFQDLQKMFELYLKEQGRHSVTISHNLPAGNIVLLSDPVRVKQVLYNLLTNSAKYTIHGQIEFGAEVKGKDIEFFVRDSGVGIKTEHHPHIFSRFFKIEDKEYSTLLRGAGIGLSISKMIIEKLGGRIWMHSEYGKGSIFRFLLHDVITKPEQIEQAPGPAHLPFNKKGKILVTEDDESNLLLIKMMLKKMDISFVVAFNGQEALEKYEKEPGIQLVLMDINLPVMDGNEAMKRLKHINPELPVIALTAHAMRGDKEKALNMGFDSYLTKPVYQEELAECLQKFLK